MVRGDGSGPLSDVLVPALEFCVTSKETYEAALNRSTRLVLPPTGLPYKKREKERYCRRGRSKRKVRRQRQEEVPVKSCCSQCCFTCRLDDCVRVRSGLDALDPPYDCYTLHMFLHMKRPFAGSSVVSLPAPA
jgi:hypothetical protein